MSNVQYGQVGWDDVDTNVSNSKADREEEKKLFLSLQEGTNKIRVLTNPHQYMVHTYKEAGDAGWGFKVKCSKHNGKCILCDRAEKYRDSGDKEFFAQQKAKKRWYIGVIDRKTDSYKILDISWSVFSALKEYNDEEAWGDPKTYEINIKVNKKAGPTGWYTTMPIEKRPLSASDLAIKKQALEEKAEELVARCQPPAPEDVVKQVEGIKKYMNSQAEKNGQRKSVETAPSKPKEVVKEATSEASQFEDTTEESYDFSNNDE